MYYPSIRRATSCKLVASASGRRARVSRRPRRIASSGTGLHFLVRYGQIGQIVFSQFVQRKQVNLISVISAQHADLTRAQLVGLNSCHTFVAWSSSKKELRTGPGKAWPFQQPTAVRFQDSLGRPQCHKLGLVHTTHGDFWNVLFANVYHISNTIAPHDMEQSS